LPGTAVVLRSVSSLPGTVRRLVMPSAGLRVAASNVSTESIRARGWGRGGRPGIRRLFPSYLGLVRGVRVVVNQMARKPGVRAPQRPRTLCDSGSRVPQTVFDEHSARTADNSRSPRGSSGESTLAWGWGTSSRSVFSLLSTHLSHVLRRGRRCGACANQNGHHALVECLGDELVTA
jgi:hypothetical protein